MTSTPLFTATLDPAAARVLVDTLMAGRRASNTNSRRYQTDIEPWTDD
jgi:hypothetical protein